MKKTGLLFTILFLTITTFSQQTISLDNALSHKGDSVTVSGKIFGGAFLKNVKTKPTFLNMGDSLHADRRLMIRIEPEDRDKFSAAPESLYVNKNVSVTGILSEYKGSAMIRISEPGKIQMEGKSNAEILVRKKGDEVLPKRPSLARTPTGTAESSTVITAAPAPPDTIFHVEPVDLGRRKNTTKNEKNIHKQLVLRASPQNSAPVVAILDPGTVIVIPYLTKKWTYVYVKTDNGISKIFGFIKTRALRYLKSQRQQ